MSALAVVVAALKRGDLSALQRTLHQLGEKHQEYGVQPSDFPIVGQALLESFPTYLSAQDMSSYWTSAHHDAWMQGYAVVQAMMLDGSLPAPAPSSSPHIEAHNAETHNQEEGGETLEHE